LRQAILDFLSTICLFLFLNEFLWRYDYQYNDTYQWPVL
jgi:hypothetical protein